MANQGSPRTADEPYGEASFGTFASHSFPIVISSRKAALKGRLLLPNGRISYISVPYVRFLPFFLPFGKVARIFPLHLPSVLERRRFWGGVSELEGHLPVLSGIL